MNDAIERAFEQLHATCVPEGPSEELIQTTLRSIKVELQPVEPPSHRRWTRLSTAVAASALVLISLIWFAPRKPASPPERHTSVTSAEPGTSAFIEADQLQAGQTFLLPLDGPAVCIDPATWPDELFF